LLNGDIDQKHNWCYERNDAPIKDDRNPSNSNNQTNEERKKKQDEKCRKYNDAPICKHCNKKFPSKAKDKCCELDKHKDSRPSMWKSTKSTWRCVGSKIVTETWQPGVIQDKLKENHTYLVRTNYWTLLDDKDDEDEEDEEEMNMLLSTPTQVKKKSNKWMRQIAKKKTTTNNHWLRHNLSLHEQRLKLTHRRSIVQNSIPPRSR
jgi:hypothetical protein